MDRAEQIAWAKKRALDLLNAGDLTGAYVSFVGDTQSLIPQHSAIPAALLDAGMDAMSRGDAEALRRWIEGFN